MITLGIAGLKIRCENKFKYIEKLASDYMEDGAHDFSVGATAEEISAEAAASPFSVTDEYCESIVIYRNIAEQLPLYDALVFHGAVIAYEGKAYAVTARSGVGKTTHIRLWKKEFGDKMHVLNGDKPVLRIINGKVFAAGTPWRGKEGYGKNEMLPLSGIAFISRDAENSARAVLPEEASVKFLSQVYLPKKNINTARALKTANEILSKVPFYEFYVNMELGAAVMARDVFTKNKFSDNKSNERIKL